MKHTTKFGRALRTTLLSGAVMAIALPAFAQQQAADDKLEEIVVTGSRIKTEGLVANSPITTISAEEIAFSQPVAAEEIIKQLPAVVPSIGPGTNNGSNGGASLDLRNLGEERTLVLMDGRRMTPFNLDGFVDTNVIPIALLERADLVTGGASAVYGADAVAGVVNFILKRDFEGMTVAGSYGMSDESDAKRFKGDITVGGSFDDNRGNIAMSIGYTDTQALLQGSRPTGLVSLSSTTGLPQGSGTDVPVQLSVASGGPGLTGVAGQINTTTGAIGPAGPGFNFQPVNLYQSPMERYQFTAIGRYELTDWAEVYTQALYTRSNVNTQLAESGSFLNVYQVPIGNPFIPTAARNQICAARGIPAAQCVVGNTTEVPITLGRRFVELGPRLNNFENKWFQYTLGVRGDIAE
ncbi:MAG: TonB-dependent receptor plug domain-containing protein, partial [Rhodospirillaceae bacterium]|nr:TonB-dependent receptor plug domain-containing protein [Rhodospirillaceae bacterium]